MAVSLLVTLALVASTTFAREYNCTVDESLCTGSGMQTIFVSSLRMCCPPTATFSLNGENCKCLEPDVIAEQQCLQGVVQCRDASSFSTDSRGLLRCCMHGFVLNSVTNSYVNGVLMDFCTCTPAHRGAGSFLSTFMGLNNNGAGMGIYTNGASGSSLGGPGQFNSTEFSEQWRNMADAWRRWGQNFGQGFRQWGDNFGKNMRGTGLDLARSLSGSLQNTLRGTMLPVQKALNDMVANVFRSIPGF